MAIDFIPDEEEFGFEPDEGAVATVPELDDIDEDLKANIPADYEDRIRNSLHYSRALSLNPEAAFDLEPQLNEELFGKSTLPENPAVLFKDAFKQSLADKPAMMLKGLEVFTPGRALGFDSMLDKSATFLQSLNDPERIQELQEVAAGKLWPTGEDRRWWQVEARFIPEVINTWSVNVADQIPIMLATLAGRTAGKAIGKPLGALAGTTAALVTGGPDPSDVVTAPAVVAIVSEITKHLGGAAPLVAMEAGNFTDASEQLEIDRDIAEKYARPYALGSGTIEYAQQLWLLGRYSKITKAAQTSILKQVLGHIGGSLFEGVEELTQQGLQNFLMQKAVAEMKERHPDYEREAPKITEGLKRSGQVGAGVAFLTGLPGTGMSIVDGAATRMRAVSPQTKKFLGEPSTQEQAQAAEKAAKPSKTPAPPTGAEPGAKPVAAQDVEPTAPTAAPAAEKGVALPRWTDDNAVDKWLATNPPRPVTTQNAGKRRRTNIEMLQSAWDRRFAAPPSRVPQKLSTEELNTPEGRAKQRIIDGVDTIENEQGKTINVHNEDIITVASELLQKEFGFPSPSRISEATYFTTDDDKRIRIAAHSVVRGEDPDVFIGIGSFPDADVTIPVNASIEEIQTIIKRVIEQLAQPAPAAGKVQPAVKKPSKPAKAPAAGEGVGVKEIEQAVQQAGINAETFELQPEKVAKLGLQKIALKIKGEVFAFVPGEQNVFNHADILQKHGTENITTEDVVPGFIDTQGRFIEQFEKQPATLTTLLLSQAELARQKPAQPAPAAGKVQPAVKKPSKKLPKEPTKLRADVTGILGGVPAQEAAGLTRAEIEHLAPGQQRALRAAQKRGLKVGFKQGVAETITDARRTMAALITKRDINEKNKMDLASIVLTYVPKKDQGRFVRRILDLKTPKQARQLTALVREAAEGLIERGAVREAKKSLSEQVARIPRFGRRMKLRGAAVDKIKEALEALPGDAVAELDVAELKRGRRLDAISLKKLSAAKKKELEGVRDELKELGFAIEENFKVPDPEELGGIEALVGEKVLVQLRRLQTDSIANMTSEEINSIADAIRYALDQDSKETKEQKKENAGKRLQERIKAKVEVTRTKAAAKIDTKSIPLPISMPERVYNVAFQDSLHRWALVESATSNVPTTTQRVLDLDIHKGKTKKLGKDRDGLRVLWAELDRIKWGFADFDRKDEVHKVKLGGKTYDLTTADIMSLGMNAKSDRNAKQIVRVESLKIGRGRGRKVKTPTMGEIVDAMEVLTDKEIAMMDIVRPLNEKVLMPAINEVSEEMLGLILAVDPDYWGLKRVMGKTVRGRTVAAPAIEDLGVFQPFLGSKIQLRIVPFWDQLLAQIQTASSLHGMAQPMEVARSLLNDGVDRPGYTSWQTVMDNMGRRREKENLLTIFERIQGIASDKDNIDIVGSTWLNRAAKAILGWRLSTMAIQAASYPIAFTEVPREYSVPLPGLKVQRGAAQSKRINEFSAFLWMRQIGGRTSIVTGDAAAADAVDTLIFQQAGDKSLEGMKRVDRRTIEEIDVNVQRWVADTTKLKVGGKTYWEEVARRTDEVVRKTQPMWDVDERSVLASYPNFAVRSLFIFRSAREAVYNQNLMAVDRFMKARDKKAAIKGLANTLTMTTISTLMVVGIGLAVKKSISALWAAITGRKAPGEDDEPKDKVTGFLADVVETTVEYAPLGGVAVGLFNLAFRTGRFADVDPDAILIGGPVAIAKGAGHLTAAYEAYFKDGDEDKVKLELVAAFNDIVDGIARLRGIPAGGILQLTTQPLERALRQKKEIQPIKPTLEE